MTTTGRRSIQASRRALGALLALGFLALPFVRVGGEGALRFDVASLSLHVAGATLAINELFVVLPATMLVTFAFLLVTVAFGRVWCGWACPQTVLGDLTRLVTKTPGKRPRRARRALGFLWCALLSILFGAATLWYLVPPLEFAQRALHGELSRLVTTAWAVLSATLFLDLAFLRAGFCATACPYAKLQGVLYDRSTLLVAYDERRAADCIDCGACVRCCPTGIDIRHGLQMECIACAECVDACRPIMLKLRRPTDLVGYFFGEPGRARALVRPATLTLGALTLLALGATVAAATSASRSTLDLTVVPASNFAARLAPDGTALDALEVSLESRARGPVTVRLSATAPGTEIRLRPALVTLDPGEHKRLRVMATACGPAGRVTGTLRAEATLAGEAVTRVSPFLLVVPERR
jgi:polyferredoxin